MKLNIGIGIYKKEDFQEILKLSEDRADMEESWEEWAENKLKAVRKLNAIDLYPIDIIVTPKELVKYCRANGFKINGESRSKFVAFKVTELYDK